MKSQSIPLFLFRWSKRALTTTVWVSAFLFGVYILAFYADAMMDNQLSRWNEGVSVLYEEEDEPVATAGIGLHFVTGGILLLLGSIQFIPFIQTKWPVIHRWSGRIYVIASILTAVGGLLFVLFDGTIGGIVMDIAFGLYGVLMLLSAIETIRHARSGRFDKHRLWALRLYALAIGSWLYRMEYGFIIAVFDGADHTDDFRGYIDYFMSFFFYLPNLLIVEWMVRGQNENKPSNLLLWGGSILFIGATLFLIIATQTFLHVFWAEPILEWFE